MLALKQAIQLDFQDLWATTPIHFLGFNFDSTGINEWIKVNITPVSNDILDVSETLHNEQALIEVFCYARTLHNATLLADAVEKFIRNTEAYSVRTNTSYDQNQLDGNLWYQTIRINAFNMNGISVLSYLVDNNLDFLVDDNLDRLIT